MAQTAVITWPGPVPPACLVSGAGGGLGRAVAERLARAGATVVITSRDRDRAAANPDDQARSQPGQSDGQPPARP